MIVEWLSAAPVILVAAIVVFLPGLLPLFVIGMRGLALFALAPVVGTAFAAGGAIVFDSLGVRWTPWTYVALIVATSAIAVILRMLCGRVRSSPSSTASSSGERVLLLVAIGIGVLLGAWSLIAYIGAPDGISQTNDAIFHLNAVRYTIESGSASSLAITGFTGSTAFYPAAWHAFASQTAMISGASIPVALNALALVTGAVIWPIGMALLVRITTRSQALAAYAAVLSGVLQSFPLLMFQWGVLYPNALSIALLPAAIAAVVSAPSLFDRARRARSAVLIAIVLMCALVALLLSQPTSALVWGLLSAIWVSFWAMRRDAGSLTARITIAGVVWIALLVLWVFFARSTSGSHWPTFRSAMDAAVDVVLNRQMAMTPSIVVSAFMLIGFVAALRQRSARWLAAGFLALSILYIAVASVNHEGVRAWLLGPWYADPNRIAALAPVMVIPLAAIGVDASMRAVAQVVRARGARKAWAHGVRAAIGLAAVTLIVAVATITRSPATPSFTEGEPFPHSRYEITDDTFLTIDERALLESLPEYVESDARIIGNPSTGSGFGYALTGLDVYPKSWAQPTTDAWVTISSGLRDVADDPAVCDALGVLGSPDYVLDFGEGEDGPGRYVLPGMTDFTGRAGWELVTAVGDASLWRINAC